MKTDYSELVRKIPDLLEAVEQSRADEDEFLDQMKTEHTKQIRQLKKAIIDNSLVCIILFRLSGVFHSILFRRLVK